MAPKIPPTTRVLRSQVSTATDKAPTGPAVQPKATGTKATKPKTTTGAKATTSKVTKPNATTKTASTKTTKSAKPKGTKAKATNVQTAKGDPKVDVTMVFSGDLNSSVGTTPVYFPVGPFRTSALFNGGLKMSPAVLGSIYMPTRPHAMEPTQPSQYDPMSPGKKPLERPQGFNPSSPKTKPSGHPQACGVILPGANPSGRPQTFSTTNQGKKPPGRAQTGEPTEAGSTGMTEERLKAWTEARDLFLRAAPTSAYTTEFLEKSKSTAPTGASGIPSFMDLFVRGPKDVKPDTKGWKVYKFDGAKDADLQGWEVSLYKDCDIDLVKELFRCEARGGRFQLTPKQHDDFTFWAENKEEGMWKFYSGGNYRKDGGSGPSN